MNYKNRGLQTDFYELTMAQGYYNEGIINNIATFELYYRTPPFNGGYAISCGMYDAIHFLKHYQFNSSDLEFLKSQDKFTADFLEYLISLRFSGEVRGVVEGTIVFPYEPILQITGSLGTLQLVESALLNIVNYQTLIATKASRITNATRREDTVLEFGLRRAQGDGHLTGARAAIIGGCFASSNTLAGKEYGIPVVGTQGHSWIQSFPTELESFRKYYESFPESTILLVDTYNTLESGVPNAIKIAKEMEKNGNDLKGIRIDSGDLAWLSIEAAKLLDSANLFEVKIVLSSDLDEFIIESIVNQINSGLENETEFEFTKRLLDRLRWGVGTKLITGSGNDKAALGGVYKLVEIDDKPVVKISENRKKTSNPGKKTIWRVRDKNLVWIADVIGLAREGSPKSGDTIYHNFDSTKSLSLDDCNSFELHVDLLKKYEEKGLKDSVWKESRNHVKDQLKEIDPTHLRFLNPHIYKISLTQRLFDLKQNFIRQYNM